MAQLVEQQMALGDLVLPLDYSEDLVEALDFYNHVLLYKDGVRYGPPMVLLRRTVSKEGIGIGCRSSEWWLGLDKDGQFIEDTEYLACNNKLSNGSFELLDILGDPLYWSRSELSKWAAVASGGVEVASVTADSTDAKDDVLRSEESFEAFAGHSHVGTVQISRGSGSAGLLRLRHVYGGRFDHPNLIVDPGFELGLAVWGSSTNISIVTDAVNARSGTGVMKVGPIPKPVLGSGFSGWTLEDDIVISGGAMVLGPNHKPDLFEGAGFDTGWTFGDHFAISALTGFGDSSSLLAEAIPQEVLFFEDFEGSFPPAGWSTYGAFGDTWEGSSAAAAYGAKSAHPTIYHTSDEDGKGSAYLKAPAIPIQQGTQVRVQVWVHAGALTTDDAQGSGGVSLYGPAMGPDADETPTKQTITPRGRWELLPHDFTVASDNTLDPGVALNVDLFVENRAFDPLDQWWFDGLAVIKTKGNYSYAVREPVTVTEGQSYELVAMVLAGWSGSLTLNAIVFGNDPSGGVTHSQTVSAGDPEDGNNPWQRVGISFTPEEGYTAMFATLRSEDITGGDGFFIDEIKLLQANNVVARAEENGTIAVSAGTSYRLAGLLSSPTSVKDGDVTIGVTLSGPGKDDIVVNASQGPTKGKTVEFFTDVRVDDGYTTAKRFVEVKDAFTGSFSLYSLTFTQTDNNRDRITQNVTIALTPERTSKLLASGRSDVTAFRGDVRFSALLTSTGRPDVTIESSPIGVTEGEWVLSDFSITPPSGYDVMTLSVVATDTEGGFFWIDDLSLVDQDSGTLVYDAKSVASGSETLTLTTTAPTGTESVHVELVAESQAGGWTADLVEFRRVGTPVQASAIIASLLGTSVGVVAGTLHSAGPILYDWHVKNLTYREVLRHLSRAGLVLPHREWRITEDNALDWGLPSEICEDRTDIVLSTKELELIEEPDVEENVETQVSRVKVVGADRQRPDRTHVQITGEATSPITGSNPYGQAINRPRIVDNPQADHKGYAEGLASYEVERNTTKQSARFRISDPAALGEMFRVGDWIDVHFPEAGFEDLTNPKDSAGQTVYPQKVRVLSKTTQMGPGFSAVLRRPNEDDYDLPVNWETDTTIEIEVAPGDGLGGLLDEFSSDPQGPAPGPAFTAWRLFTRR